MVVPPLKVLSPVRTNAPSPAWVSEPLPEIAPAKVMSSLRSKAREPLSATSPLIEPVVPTSPIC
jgi:hypothetical protein